MFRSYQAGRANYVTLIADYVPLQDAYGGPNYFQIDPDALYEIHIDNNGDAMEDISFQLRFTNTNKNAAVNVGGKQVQIPLIISGGGINSVNSAANECPRNLYRDGAARRAAHRSGTGRHQCRDWRKHLRQADRQHRQQVDS
jgi:hypothetical protein